MTAMKLIGSLTSPFVRKVRIVMAEKKLECQLVLEDVWANDEVQKFNPLGQVPCLVMEGKTPSAARCSTRAPSSSTWTRSRRWAN